MKKYILAACTFAIIAMTSCGSLDMYRMYTVEPSYTFPAIFENEMVKVEFTGFVDDATLRVSISNKSKSLALIKWGEAYIDQYNVSFNKMEEEKLYSGLLTYRDIHTGHYAKLFKNDEIKKYGYAQRSVSIPIEFGNEEVLCNVSIRIAKDKKTRLKDAK